MLVAKGPNSTRLVYSALLLKVNVRGVLGPVHFGNAGRIVGEIKEGPGASEFPREGLFLPLLEVLFPAENTCDVPFAFRVVDHAFRLVEH